MPQSDYVSLTTGGGNPQSVYQSTTEPHGASKSVMETVKRVIGTAIGAQDKHALIERDAQPYIISSRDRTGKGAHPNNARMPSAPAHTAEEARLLG
ncbi:N-myc downstream regulated [Culex quinquefasciatus]|uniref:N-myc downstream regulated n=3 Tax=Culex pipiens complex TaxID=518105 RepID=B0X786_CULQU|nr:N-myc downstream regulated [Culex quinquefasciatus]|eukprot:XP_001865508.1 N-myc downstream regulated [Culex quinquefasciatus]